MLNDTLYGPMDMPNWPDDLIVQTIRDYGEWGAVEAALFARLLPENAILWDCGAFLGSFTLGVARQSKLSSALAIEANPELAPFLESNLTRLSPYPATAISGGIGAHRGTLRLLPQDKIAQNRGSQTYDFEETEPSGPGTIPCHTLKDLRALHGDYTALKLDVEGMEVDIIKGDYMYVKDRQPILWVECNENRGSLQILSAMKSLGYDPVYIAFPAFRKDNHLGNPDLQYPYAYEAALFAAPRYVLESIDWTHEAFAGTILRPVSTIFDLRKALFDTPRWGRQDWENLSHIELVARLTRALTNQKLKKFLV
jgi:FkbM family methyltransferase